MWRCAYRNGQTIYTAAKNATLKQALYTTPEGMGFTAYFDKLQIKIEITNEDLKQQ